MVHNIELKDYTDNISTLLMYLFNYKYIFKYSVRLYYNTFRLKKKINRTRKELEFGHKYYLI